jgi:Na+-translocating ferredoxin:NAD+ oxidoreductase subunit G
MSEMVASEASPSGNHLSQAWLILLLALLYGGALAGVQAGLGPIIAKNKLQETLGRVPGLIPGSSSDIQPRTVTIDNKDVIIYQSLDENGTTAGWVVPAKGQGYADTIEVLIGLDRDCATITGLYVLAQKETPALGDKITTPEFQTKFVGLTTSRPLQAVKRDASAPHEFRAITGATVSSVSVAKIVNDTVRRFADTIRALPEQAAEEMP